jgi:hypothetical protein
MRAARELLIPVSELENADIIYATAASAGHDEEGHPECAMRISAIVAALEKAELDAQVGSFVNTFETRMPLLFQCHAAKRGEEGGCFGGKNLLAEGGAGCLSWQVCIMFLHMRDGSASPSSVFLASMGGKVLRSHFDVARCSNWLPCFSSSISDERAFSF